MPMWRLEPGDENQVIELQIWSKGSDKLIRKELFAHSSFLSNSMTRPDVDLNNNLGLEVTSGGWSLERLDSRPGGPWVTWTYPVSMTDDERNEINKLIDIDMYSSLEQQGWVFEKTEYWFYGPLILTEVKQ